MKAKMNIGFFTRSHNFAILVVYDYEKYLPQVEERGFILTPFMVREATTPEEVAYEEGQKTFPAWTYYSLDELLADEVKSGASLRSLSQLKSYGFYRWDDEPQPMEGASK